jgi:hypothetical protein
MVTQAKKYKTENKQTNKQHNKITTFTYLNEVSMGTRAPWATRAKRTATTAASWLYRDTAFMVENRVKWKSEKLKRERSEVVKV